MKYRNSDNKVMKVAFLGGGVDSAIGMSHFVGLRMDKKFDLVAGCFSKDKGMNEQSAKKYGIDSDRCYSSINDLINNEKDRIDAVVILTPTNQHFDQIIKFIENDIPIICEKSLTSTYEESLEIKKVVDNKFLAVVYNYLGYPIIKEFRHIIESDKIGSVQNIKVEMPSQAYCKFNLDGSINNPQSWRLKDGFIPTISLDLGTHLHSLVKFITNEVPKRVVADYKGFGHHNNIIDNVSIIAEYSSNISCNYWYSKSSFGYNNGMRVRVLCSKGSVEWVQEDPEFLTLVDKFGSKKYIERSSPEIAIANQEKYNRFKSGHPIGYMEAFANYYSDIYDLLVSFYDGDNQINNSIYSIDTAIEGLSLLNSASHSVKNKSWAEIGS